MTELFPTLRTTKTLYLIIKCEKIEKNYKFEKMRKKQLHIDWFFNFSAYQLFFLHGTSHIFF